MQYGATTEIQRPSPMSAIDTKQTCQPQPRMSAFGGNADMPAMKSLIPRYTLHLSLQDKVLRRPVETTANSGHWLASTPHLPVDASGIHMPLGRLPPL